MQRWRVERMNQMTIDEIKNLRFKGYAWLKILPFSDSLNESRTYFDIYENLTRDMGI